MLVKCESKSTRVKAVCFHKELPWVLVGLHTGTIQLWDYRRSCVLHKFEGHVGPVRALHFHPTQSLFCSGGDDHEISVWDYDRRVLLFRLTGHLDYVRTVEFHSEYPWILSASDDQTLRIWNWQSRQCISVLAGHHHFVMCARFHPSFDLIASCSMDQTIRLWDITGLKEKNVARLHSLADSYENLYTEHGGASGSPLPPALLSSSLAVGSQEVVCKYIIDGHERGVNWIDFHPTLNMLVSASDDRTLKLFRFDDARWWETDTLKGHYNNVSCVKFHPLMDLILSNSEDHSIRIWDLHSRKLLHTVRRDTDRFWTMDCIENTIAVGHDSGMIVFKLMRERPAATLMQTEPQVKLLCAQQNTLRMLGEDRKADSILVHAVNPAVKTATSSAAIGSIWAQYPVDLVYNSLNKVGVTLAILQATQSASSVSSTLDGYNFTVLHSQTRDCQKFSTLLASTGCIKSLQFCSRTQFVTLARNGRLELYSGRPGDDSSRIIELPPSAEDVKPPIPQKLFFGGQNRLLMRAEDGYVYLLDIKTNRFLSKLDLSLAGAHGAKGKVRYCVWHEKSLLLLSKNYLCVAREEAGTLNHVFSIHEPSRVKTAIWLSPQLVMYTTRSHLKYLTLGASAPAAGVVLAITEHACSNCYLVAARETSPELFDVFYLSNKHELQAWRQVDLTEPLLRLAMQTRDEDAVRRILARHTMPGWSWLQQLQLHQIPQIAYSYVETPAAKAQLALRFGDLETAHRHLLEIPEAGSSPTELWEVLGAAAVNTGRLDLAITAYQKSRSYAALVSLFSLTSDAARLRKLTSIARRVNKDNMALLTNLYSGDVSERVALLESLGQRTLAYMNARTHGLSEAADRLAAELAPAVLERLDARMKAFGKSRLLAPPLSILPTQDLLVWPNLAPPSIVAASQQVESKVAAPAKAGSAQQGSRVAEGWLSSDESDEEYAASDVKGTAMDTHETCDATEQLRPGPAAVSPGVIVEVQKEVGDLVAIGAFEEAQQLLSAQIADFAPLKPLFRRQYVAAQTLLPALPSLGYIHMPRKTSAGTIFRVHTLETFSEDLQAGIEIFTHERSRAALRFFGRCMLQACLITASDAASKVALAAGSAQAGQYATAIRLLDAADAETDDLAAKLQYHCLSTKLKLMPAHQFGMFRIAVRVAKQTENYVTRAMLVRKLAKLNLEKVAPELTEKIAVMKTKVLTESERNGTEAHPGAQLEGQICCSCLKLIPPETSILKCQVCDCAACQDHDVCAVCAVGRCS